MSEHEKRQTRKERRGREEQKGKKEKLSSEEESGRTKRINVIFYRSAHSCAYTRHTHTPTQHTHTCTHNTHIHTTHTQREFGLTTAAIEGLTSNENTMR